MDSLPIDRSQLPRSNKGYSITDDATPQDDSAPVVSKPASLPAEIRLIIWDCVLNQEEPRLVQLLLSDKTKIDAVIVAKPTAILYTCIESRHEALKRYPHCLEDTSGQLYRVDLRRDCFYLDRSPFKGAHGDALDSLRGVLKRQGIQPFQIRQLAIEIPKFSILLYNTVDRFYYLDALVIILPPGFGRSGAEVFKIRDESRNYDHNFIDNFIRLSRSELGYKYFGLWSSRN